jgi:hypothetical protein
MKNYTSAMALASPATSRMDPGAAIIQVVVDSFENPRPTLIFPFPRE